VTGWDVAAWVAVAVLGPGAIIIFAAFLRDVRRLFGRAPDGGAGDAPRGAAPGAGAPPDAAREP
jgi:hypothetical protein